MAENKYQIISSTRSRLNLKENEFFQLGPLVDGLCTMSIEKRLELSRELNCRRKGLKCHSYTQKREEREGLEVILGERQSESRKIITRVILVKGTIVEVWHLKRIFITSTLSPLYHGNFIKNIHPPLRFQESGICFCVCIYVFLFECVLWGRE